MQTAAATVKVSRSPLLAAVCVVWSAALLFVVQPMIAKTLLPRFGGSAAVWVTCMLFFQAVLLLGYLYSYCVTRYLAGRAQALVHLALLAISVGAVLARPSLDRGIANPTVAILLALAGAVGLPYFALATTSPLLQSWAASAGAPFPYRLFSFSNAASMLALLAYPAAIEPFVSTRLQILSWSGGYIALAALLAVAALRSGGVPATGPADEAEDDGTSPWLWIALAACGSTVWLAITNYLGQQVGAMPLLWVIPMAVYLLSFVVVFQKESWYRPAVFRWLLPAAWLAIVSRLALEGSLGGLEWELPVLCAALFVCCVFCHGELARSKPAPQGGLAFFYLMVACGGALGGLFVGVVAPNVFPAFLELPIGVVASVLLALYFLFGLRSPRRLLRLALVAAVAFVISTQLDGARLLRSRNFYGVLEVRESGRGFLAARTLYSGRTIHGRELLAPGARRTPTAYYSARSGAGLVFRAPAGPRRIAVVGLGAGSLAAYGRSGDLFRFYEINPAVVRIAQEDFDFLRDTPAATQIVLGDGRLMLEREPLHSFDVVALDAFSDDAIPVHLLTREAFRVYFDRLRPGGLLLVHMSSRYLDLGAEVEALARDAGKAVVIVHNASDATLGIEAADWAILAADARELAPFSIYAQLPSARRAPVWTDDYSSLVRLWR